MEYIAFLRGINVGGHTIKMDELKNVFSSLGFTNVKTILASGNVIFRSKEKNASDLQKKIEDTLQKKFGYAIPVVISTSEEITLLVASAPFGKVTMTPEKRRYVTLLSEKVTSTLKIPYISPEKDFTILHVSDKEVCSVMTISGKRNSTDAMKILEKEFGKKITTRNWNTIQKIQKALEHVM